MRIAFICQEMKWTYQEYMQQPVWLIDMIIDKMELDANIASEKLNK